MRRDAQAGSGRSLAALAFALALIATACGGDDSADLETEVVETYAAGVHAMYEASLDSATAMDEAIDTFVADPSEATLTAAKDAWLAARDDYGPTEAFRFYGGPIDADDTGVEGLVNAWPLDEAYIDYVDGAPEAGIVNMPDEFPVIDADVLVSLNEEGGETNISTGWHAVEFLLWGQDLAEDGPGTRSVDDYTTAANADRRATYLTVASDLLLEHLGGLVAAWEPDADNYRAEFLALDTTEAVGMIITGIGELSGGELAGERMAVAYEARSQEDEHSCFSDNTTQDIIANAAGVAAVVNGEYGSVTGPGIAALAGGEDEALENALSSQVDASVASATTIPAPFDQHLRIGVPDSDPGRMSILTTIETLEAQADLIGEVAAVLDIQVGG